MRTWDKDDSTDLSGTMAALDTALARGERAAGWLGGRPKDAPADDAPIGADLAESSAEPTGPAAEPEPE
jgi:hypothetical protein